MELKIMVGKALERDFEPGFQNHSHNESALLLGARAFALKDVFEKRAIQGEAFESKPSKEFKK